MSARRDVPEEMPAVKTTIVGGRPPGAGKPLGPIPRGIEVLVKKAAVDEAFRQRLLEARDEAAGDIDLPLDPSEAMMLKAVPREQLASIIDNTTVPRTQRAAFLGRAAGVMLVALGAVSGLAYGQQVVRGVRIRPPQPGDRPVEKVKRTRLNDDQTKMAAKLVEQLGSEQFKAREAADKQLFDLGTGVLPLLKEHREHKDPEVRQRLADLYRRMTGADIATHDPSTLVAPPPATQGVRPDRPSVSEGIRPDTPKMSKGIRPDKPEMSTRGGQRPDKPPLSTEGGIRPDRTEPDKNQDK